MGGELGGGRDDLAALWECPGQLKVTWESGNLYLHFFFFLIKSKGCRTFPGL